MRARKQPSSDADVAPENATGDRPLAFLVDGENANASLAAEMLAEASKYGTVIIRKVYGDWSSPRMNAWREVLGEHALVPVQQFPNISGKNAIDIALIVDAMDILHSGVVTGFCLASSDSDYTRLATRIREAGLFAMGIGNERTPDSLRNACDIFVVTRNLAPLEGPAPARGKRATEADARGRPPPKHALRILEKAFSNVVGDDGLAHMSPLAEALRKLDPAFDPRTYGKTKLVDLIEALPETFAVERRGAPGRGAVYVRRRRAPKG